MSGFTSEAQPFAYVANSLDDTVSVIDTTTDTVVDTVEVGDGPQGVAISPDGARVYVTNLLESTVSVIDAGSNNVLDTIAVAPSPKGIVVSPDDSVVYVAGQYGVEVIDTETYSVLTTASGPTTGTLEITPSGSTVYFATGSATVGVLDIPTLTVKNMIPAFVWGGDMAASPDGERVYLTTFSFSSGFSLEIIDTSENRIFRRRPSRWFPDGLAVSPDGSRVYWGVRSGLSLFETIRDINLGTIPLDEGRRLGVVVTHDGERVYFTGSSVSCVGGHAAATGLG